MLQRVATRRKMPMLQRTLESDVSNDASRNREQMPSRVQVRRMGAEITLNKFSLPPLNLGGHQASYRATLGPLPRPAAILV